jgi:ATP-dependent DNA helicase RecG
LDQDYFPTTLGMLLGGFDPTVFVPGAYFQFVRYDGTDVGADIQGEEEIRDNLITATQTLTALLRAQLTHRPVTSDILAEKTVVDYPMSSVREAVMNAVAHRAYEATHAPIRILWFDDHVTITNPGGPFGAVTENNYDQVNDYRNPSLAAAMKNLGLVNRFGRGIERMRMHMEKNGNPPPEFAIDQSSWRVTLHKKPGLGDK